MERYKTYKPSRVIWINEFPSHWIEKQNKHILYDKKDEVGIEWKNYQLLSLSKKGVIKRDIDSGKGKFPESFENYKKVECDDLIFCLYDIEETPRTVGLSNYRGMITSSYKIYKCSENPKFVYYWYLTIDDFKGLKPFYTGMRNVVRPETFLSLKIYLPPLQEQHQIVQFLDEKTELIDKLISTKERKISLLKEQRTSFINQVVTKGLNPNVEMKDSGVEWIGEIPSHWIVLRNKYFTQSQKNKSQTGEEELLSVSEYHGVIPRKNIREGEEHLTRSESLEGYLKVRKGELVSNIMLMWKRGLGVSEYEGIVSPSYSVFSFHNSEPKYFHYLYRTDQYVSEFRRNSTGVIESRLRLYDDSFGSLFSHFPPLSEQQQIVEFLDEKTKEIDDMVHLEQKKIDLLKEYRQSLISEVVTGKIKVTTDE